jgi:predicted transcriptional regulator
MTRESRDTKPATTKAAPLARPTEGEHAILTVLWERGPSTVRAVHEALAHRGTGYTTVLKLLQIMTDKGLVVRDERDKSHIYSAKLAQKAAEKRLIRDLVDKAFGGSATRLIASALSDRPAKKAELAEIRALLDALEEKAK